MSSPGPWWTRPGIVLSILGALLLLAGLLERGRTPTSGGRLTTLAGDAGGLRGYFDIAARLGWRVEQRTTLFRAPLDSTAVYVILEAPVPLTSSEASAVLDAVRRGAGLLLAPGASSVLADSLHLRRSARAVTPISLASADPTFFPPSLRRGRDGLPFDWPHYSIRLTAPPDRDTTALLTGDTTPRNTPGFRRSLVILGLPVGKGRVVAIGDPDLFRNQILRQGDAAVPAVRILDWLSRARPARVVFSEYHQGFGAHPSMARAVIGFLSDSPPGRAITQLLAAALLLLLAVGARPLTPETQRRIQRRSAMEHVGALSHAYEQVAATRTAVRRLVRGIRRRHPLGTIRSGSDEEYLAALGTRYPALAPETRRLERGMREPLPSAEFATLGDAVMHIEETVAT